MPRKPRIEIAGYYHIINRGVEQKVIFKETEDYEYFEELMCFYAKSFGIMLHNYCLMGNHYHLLIEITQENLSKFMRQLNMNYAICKNRSHSDTLSLNTRTLNRSSFGQQIGVHSDAYLLETVS